VRTSPGARDIEAVLLSFLAGERRAVEDGFICSSINGDLDAALPTVSRVDRTGVPTYGGLEATKAWCPLSQGVVQRCCGASSLRGKRCG
jgi:hypothetical protein